MGNNPANLKTVVLEKDGWQLGHNENPDVEDLDESERWILVSPSGKPYVGSRKTLEKHLSDEPANKAWRERNA
jgi:hypothetical protein